MARLKSCPDTKQNFSAACKAVRFLRDLSFSSEGRALQKSGFLLGKVLLPGEPVFSLKIASTPPIVDEDEAVLHTILQTLVQIPYFIA